MKVQYKHAMRLEEAGAPKTSVRNYGNTCCRNTE